jgi:hypothetical protein
MDEASLPVAASATPSGSGGSVAPAGAAGEERPVVDASRFVFGAIPGKHAVYWIHTEW